METQKRTTDADERLVSVIIPVLNEEKYIANCVESVLNQDFPKKNLELILVDGGSEDRTVEIIKDFADKYDFIKLCENPKKTVQHALNIGIRNAVGKYVVRMDAHSEYAGDYISECVRHLEKTNAANVGGPMIARGKSRLQKVIAAAYHSPFALGGGKFHYENYEGYADTVYLGAFKRETLMKLGLYDEDLPRNEDDDLNLRIMENGGKVYVTPKIKSVYYPRDCYRALFKQYFEYGMWKVAVIKKHGKFARVSHLLPILFFLFIVIFSVLSLFSKLACLTFAAVMLIYWSLSFYFSLKSKYLNGFCNKIRLAWAHFVLHIAYGSGFFCGILKFWDAKFGCDANFTKKTI